MPFNRTHLQEPETTSGNNRAAERYPVAFSPASSTEVNASRLPPPDELADMDLAFREEPLSEEALIRKFTPWIILFLFIGPTATTFSLMIGRVIPLGAALVGVTLVGLIAAAVLFVIPRNRNYRLIVGLVVVPPIYVTVMGKLTGLIGSRLWAVIFLAVVIAFLFFFVDKHLRPLQFYKEWIFAHPRLKPETRRNIPALLSLRPSVVLCIITFLFLTVGYAYWPSLFMGLVFGALGLLSLPSLFSQRKAIARVLVHYLAYTGRGTGAAGVWMPRSSLAKRRTYVVSLALLFYAAMTIGTAFYSMPDDTITTRRAEEIAASEKIDLRAAEERAKNEYWKAPESVQGSRLTYLWWLTWNKHTDPYQVVVREFSRAPVANTPVEARPGPREDGLFRNLWDDPLMVWLRFDLLGFSAQLWSHTALFIHLSLIAIIVSNAWLFFIFAIGGIKARVLREGIEGYEQKGPRYRITEFSHYLGRIFGYSQQRPPATFVPSELDNDGRTEWQWYVDRLRMSDHCAKDPFGNTVREAEHLFLGVEPSLQIPVLLDRKIVSEHCYIVGQTGSGKTTLGIMPLLIQLMRGYNNANPDKYKKSLSHLLNSFIEHARKVQENAANSNAPAVALKDMLTYFFSQHLLKEGGENALHNETAQRLHDELQAMVRNAVRGRKKAKSALKELITYAEEKGIALGDESAGVSLEFIREPLTSPPVPIVIIDLKGDPALFHTVKAEAEARGQEFLFFTPEKGKVSHRFNPFVGFKSEARTFIQLCQLFLDSLSLNHGEGYGRSYYSRRNRQALFLALTHPSKPQTFEELLDVMNEMFKSAEHRDAYEALTTIQALSQYEALVTTAEQEAEAPETVINMPRVIEKNQVVYFWLPSAIESISAKEIGKLALFALLTAAIDRQLTNPQAETKQVYLVVDEFQRLAGENFKIILEQARSFGLSAILANQTLADLRTKDSDLRSTVLTNTRMRLFFTVNDPMEMKMLSTLSGEEIRLLKSWTATDDFRKYLRRDTQSETVIEGFKPRLTVNDIASISDHPLEMIAHITRGNGYTQFGGLPIRVRTAWPIPKEEYEKRTRTPWPTKEEFGLNEVIENLRSPKEIDEEALREVSEKQQATLKKVLGELNEQAETSV